MSGCVGGGGGEAGGGGALHQDGATGAGGQLRQPVRVPGHRQRGRHHHTEKVGTLFW